MYTDQQQPQQPHHLMKAAMTQCRPIREDIIRTKQPVQNIPQRQPSRDWVCLATLPRLDISHVMVPALRLSGGLWRPNKTTYPLARQKRQNV